MFQDISCIKDLTSLYNAATIEDVYIAYEQLKVDDDSLYSCIGVAGMQTSEDINGKYVRVSRLKFTVGTHFLFLLHWKFGVNGTKHTFCGNKESILNTLIVDV